MKFLSICSGIEAASLAWNPIGWEAVGFSEIDPFACALLSHRFPEIPNFGDMTQYEKWTVKPFDLLCGGTPCQAFSMAGLRKGLSDPRGNLTLVFLGLVDRFRPRWIVWENVPGVLSDKTGAFDAFTKGLQELGYHCAYRILDAQFFGVPQRRRRIFLVGHYRDWRRSAAVLFDPNGLRGNCSKSRENGKTIAGTLGARTSAGGGLGTDFELDGGLQIAHTLRGEGFDASEDGTGRGTPLICGALCANGKAAGSATQQSAESGHLVVPAVTAIWAKGTGGPSGDECQNLIAPTLTTGSGGGRYDKQPMIPVAFSGRTRGDDGRGYERPPQVTEGHTGTLDTVKPWNIAGPCGVRRLTPRECERLQGMPDDWTLVPYRGKPATDSPRYRAIGNSWAVPVARWIGERIAFVDQL